MAEVKESTKNTASVDKQDESADELKSRTATAAEAQTADAAEAPQDTSEDKDGKPLAVSDGKRIPVNAVFAEQVKDKTTGDTAFTVDRPGQTVRSNDAGRVVTRTKRADEVPGEDVTDLEVR